MSSKNSEHFFKQIKAGKPYSTGIFKGYTGPWSKLTKSQKEKALSQRWYVRWAFRNPETGKLKRQRNIYGGANRFATHKERLQVLRLIEEKLIYLLSKGFNPYNEDIEQEEAHTVSSAIDAAMEVKRLHMKPESFTRFKSDINKFKKYLYSKGYRDRFIESVTKKTVNNYLNECLETVSARSRNNYRTNISTLWQCMEDEGIVERNFVKSIKMIKSVPKRNRTWSNQQVQQLFEHLEKNDPRLLLVIELVSYNFLRPKEVMRLTVGSFNLKEKTLSVEVKGGRVRTKLIPDVMMERLPHMEGLDNDIHLIGQNGILEKWDITAESKRGRISRDFRKVKDMFGIGEDFGIYSFRHTFITKLYRKLRESLSPFEVKSKLMNITGHETMAALEKYLRSIDAELPEDYSDMLK
ncbi:tyrosine-type recombinase/integrase [Muricauda sp. TY007]|uniref:tyrosine-type recombinase/integrase n=1 Tax=Allomuricauda sp. TY007 TaxID=2683200 RepID=UPI0013C142BE|nr:tyrosine-type recombinase/integrase [Muricauda sp. TY007]NDV15564.1 tyrosine-type recombinase/integrase [Muricauda sp. TY007]